MANNSPTQAQYVVGGNLRPEVEVDTGVLDRLGREPTLPDLLLGRQPAPQRTAMAEPPAAALAGSGATARLHPQHPIILHKPLHKAVHKDPKPSVHHKAHVAKVAVTVAKSAPAKAEPPKAETAKASPAVVTPTPSEPTKVAANDTLAVKAELPPVTLPVIAPQASESKPESAAPAPARAPSVEAKVEPAEKPAAAPAATPEPIAPTPTKVAQNVAAPSADQPVATPAAKVAAPASLTAQVMPVQAVSAPMPAGQRVALAEAAMTAPAEVIQQAHMPASTLGDGPLSVMFEKEGARLPDDIRGTLSQLAERLSSDGALQIQLLAYAGDDGDTSKARRLSLSRALAVRSYLIDQGVRSTRIEVRALGNKVPEGPADRVDILVQKR